jgi:predicted DNA-binding transcriptional regulator AlpA
VTVDEYGRANTDDSLPEYLTVRLLAQLLGLVPSTLAKWRWDGSGPPFSIIGGRALYARSDVSEWIAQRRVTSTAAAQARGLQLAPANRRRAAR